MIHIILMCQFGYAISSTVGQNYVVIICGQNQHTLWKSFNVNVIEMFYLVSQAVHTSL